MDLEPVVWFAYETGKRLAAAAQEVAPDIWWTNFAANFGRVRAVHPDS